MKLLGLGYPYFYVFLTKLNMDCIILNLDRYFRSPRPIYRALVYQATARFKAFTFCFFSDVNMVRKYIKTTNRANINEGDVAAAINDITNGNCSLRNAAANYGIHFATQYRLKLFRQKHQTIVEQPVSEDGGEENR